MQLMVAIILAAATFAIDRREHVNAARWAKRQCRVTRWILLRHDYFWSRTIGIVLGLCVFASFFVILAIGAP